MAQAIKIRRGLKANLPILQVGEFGYCTDTRELFIGSTEGNVLIGGEEMRIVVKDSFSGTTGMTKTYTEDMVGFSLNNESTSDMSFVINGITVPVKAGVVFDDYFEPFKSVAITANGQFQALVKGKSGAVSGPVVTPPTDTTPPNEVTNLASSSVTTNSALISWTASNSTDVASYEIYNGATLITSLTGTSYTITGLASSTAYTLTVKSKDNSGNMSAGATVSFTTTAASGGSDTTPPTITASPNGGTFTSGQSVALSSNETATIYYTTNGSNPTTSSSIYSSPIVVNQTTTLKFFGRDSAGNSSAVQTITFTINLPDTTPPNNVTGLTVSNVGVTSLTLSWTASSSGDVASYDVLNETTLLSNVTSTSYNVTGLAAGTSYTFTVKAKDTAGNAATGTTLTVSTVAATTEVYFISESVGRTSLTAASATWKTLAFINKQTVTLTELQYQGPASTQYNIWEVDETSKLSVLLASGTSGSGTKTDSKVNVSYSYTILTTPIQLEAGKTYACSVYNSGTPAMKYGGVSTATNNDFIDNTALKYSNLTPAIGVALASNTFNYDIKLILS